MNMKKADRMLSIEWANSVLGNLDGYYILDTETTGLGQNDVVIQIAIIDMNGRIIVDSLISLPQGVDISPEAETIHGISKFDLTSAPTFPDLYENLCDILKSRTILIYNADFDVRLIKQTCIANSLAMPNFKTHCVMFENSRYHGKWSEKYGDYSYIKLTGGDHSAKGDCLATRDVIFKLSKGKVKNDLNLDGNVYSEVSKLNAELNAILSSESNSKSLKKWWEFWK